MTRPITAWLWPPPAPGAIPRLCWPLNDSSTATRRTPSCAAPWPTSICAWATGARPAANWIDLARQYDPTLTEERIARVLDSLESVQSRFQAHGRLSGGVMYDSNANQGPASDKMSLGLFDNLTVHGVKAVDSWGSYFNGMLDAGWRLGEDSPWWFVSDIAFFKRWNGNPKLPVNNDFSWGRAALGLRHMSSRTLAELRVKGEMADQSLDQRVSVLGPEGTFVWAALPNLQLIDQAFAVSSFLIHPRTKVTTCSM